MSCGNYKYNRMSVVGVVDMSRIHQNILIVDRLFGAAELRLGSGERQQVVRIVRINPTQAAADQPASATGDSPS